jgi:hypothetical protein
MAHRSERLDELRMPHRALAPRLVVLIILPFQHRQVRLAVDIKRLELGAAAPREAGAGGAERVDVLRALG